ncbi:hypothetical protein [Actinomadura sp. NPDC000600]|uniref:hypothetical protein n=1 Tax=Actinomadura sp. NPDC000600 TaxID=3154262 RepID=UPI003399E958
MTDASSRELDANKIQDARTYLATHFPPAARAAAAAAAAASPGGAAAAVHSANAAATADMLVSASSMIVEPRDVAAFAAALGEDAARVAANAARAASMEGAPWTGRAVAQAGSAARDAAAAANLTGEALAVFAAVDAALRALREAERVFTMLAVGKSGAHAVAGGVRAPGSVARRLLAAGCALLPAGDRARYNEEWLSLLTESPTRRARAAHVLSILCGTPHQAWTLRRPLKRVPPA